MVHPAGAWFGALPLARLRGSSRLAAPGSDFRIGSVWMAVRGRTVALH